MMKNGYDTVADKVREYWNIEGVTDVVVVLTADKCVHTVIAQCWSDSDFENVTFNTDWWEGEENIQVFSIVPLWEVLEKHEEEMIRLYDKEM